MRDLTWEQPTGQRPPVAGLDHGAVAQDQRERLGELLEDGPGEVIPSSGREGDFDPLVDRRLDRAAVGLGKGAVAIEKSAVNVQRQ